jgi:N-formylglutamate deformylase
MAGQGYSDVVTPSTAAGGTPAFSLVDAPDPVVTAAIHAGHDLRPEVADLLAVDEATRLREEDPFTDRLAVAGTRVTVHRSRFEVDLNRPRDEAVYRTPDDAWGLQVWRRRPPRETVARSLAIYDAFYGALADRLDRLAACGPFVVLDIHAYNHRRDGAPAPDIENPEVNVGTGSLDRARWTAVVDALVDELRRQQVAGHTLDVRENVRFQGAQLARWVDERYPGSGCALALEFKKSFMDEWTGEADHAHIADLAAAVSAGAARVAELITEDRAWPRATA